MTAQQTDMMVQALNRIEGKVDTILTDGCPQGKQNHEKLEDQDCRLKKLEGLVWKATVAILVTMASGHIGTEVLKATFLK